jgi:hypothetical protein
MKIGAKIYYDLESGEVLVNTGERSGDVIETTREQDFRIYMELANINPKLVGMIQLNYGAYSKEQKELNQIKKVDLETLEPLF